MKVGECICTPSGLYILSSIKFVGINIIDYVKEKRKNKII